MIKQIYIPIHLPILKSIRKINWRWYCIRSIYQYLKPEHFVCNDLMLRYIHYKRDSNHPWITRVAYSIGFEARDYRKQTTHEETITRRWPWQTSWFRFRVNSRVQQKGVSSRWLEWWNDRGEGREGGRVDRAANRIVRIHTSRIGVRAHRFTWTRATTLLRVSRSWHAAMYYRSAHYVSFVRVRERHLCMPGIINPFSDGWADYRSFPNVRIFVCIRIMREGGRVQLDAHHRSR